MARQRIVSRVELEFFCRQKGFRGPGTFNHMYKWLEEHNFPREKVPELVQQARNAAKGLQQQQAGGTQEVLVDMDDVRETIKMIASETIDDEMVAKIVESKVASLIANVQPKKIVLDGNKPAVKIDEHTHPLFEKVLRLVKSGLNVLLVGPAGCGKTTLAEQIAKALKRSYGTLHCTSGASESQLTGWLLPIGKSGEFKYVASEFVTLYEEGDSVFLLDEIDAADPNMLLVINSALANGALHVPQRYGDAHVERGKNQSIIAAANTYGTGADMMYAGRNQLDAATLDRFYVVQMDYDDGLEKQIIGNNAEDKALGEWCLNLRRMVKEQRMRRVVSTRTIIKAMSARRAGVDVAQIKRDILAGWTRDELMKVNAI